MYRRVLIECDSMIRAGVRSPNVGQTFRAKRDQKFWSRSGLPGSNTLDGVCSVVRLAICSLMSCFSFVGDFVINCRVRAIEFRREHFRRFRERLLIGRPL